MIEYKEFESQFDKLNKEDSKIILNYFEALAALLFNNLNKNTIL